MLSPIHSLLTVLAHTTDRELASQVQYLRIENRILRDKLPKRIVITPHERARLVRFGKPLGTTIKHLISIVVPETFARWVREAKNQKPRVRNGGRPRKPPNLRRLVLKIARETGWGYTRVLGEIRKLTRQPISRQSVANIMREAGLEPGPNRGEKSWDEFVRIHGATLWQCDFFTKRSWTLKGLRDLYVLVFLNVATRKVHVTAATANPNRELLTEQVDTFGETLSKQMLPAKLVFHDADPKLGKTFDNDLRRHGLTPRRLGPRSPNMNAFVERWIQSIQVERLDHFIVLGEAHLNYLVAEYVAHYQAERPHQGLNNALAIKAKPPDASVPGLREVTCHKRLGGLLKHYVRRAA